MIVSVRLCVGAIEVVFQNVLSSIWCLVCALILASFIADVWSKRVNTILIASSYWSGICVGETKLTCYQVRFCLQTLCMFDLFCGKILLSDLSLWSDSLVGFSVGRFHFSDCDLSVNALTREFFREVAGWCWHFAQRGRQKISVKLYKLLIT